MKQRCAYCSNQITLTPLRIRDRKRSKTKMMFCDNDCYHSFRILKGNTTLPCGWCSKPITRRSKELHKSKSKKLFCNLSHCTKFNNANKLTGTTVSKLEKFIFARLSKLYPNLTIFNNKKSIIGLELDLYIPQLHLAIELNGIHHYQPIYGLEKLQSIQKLDRKRRKLCKKNKITLLIIDTQRQHKFTPKSSQVYLNNIIKEIELRRIALTRT